MRTQKLEIFCVVAIIDVSLVFTVLIMVSWGFSSFPDNILPYYLKFIITISVDVMERAH